MLKNKLQKYYDDQKLGDERKRLLAQRLKQQTGAPLIEKTAKTEPQNEAWVRRGGVFMLGSIAAALALVIGIGFLLKNARGGSDSDGLKVTPPADSVPSVSQPMSQSESTSSEDPFASTEKPHKNGQLNLLLEGYVVDHFDPTYGNGNTFFVDEAEDITVTAEFDAQGENVKQVQYMLFANALGRQIFIDSREMTETDNSGIYPVYTSTSKLSPDMYQISPDFTCPPMGVTAFALVKYADGETMLYCDTLYNTAYNEGLFEEYYKYVEEYIDSYTTDMANVKSYIPADEYFSSIKWAEDYGSIANYLTIESQADSKLINFYTATGAPYNIITITDSDLSEPFYSAIVSYSADGEMLSYSVDLGSGENVFVAAVPMYDFDLPVVIADSAYPENITYIGDDVVEYEGDR